MACQDLIKACGFLLIATAFGGCAYAPGMNVDTAPSQFYAQTEAGPTEQGGYRLIPITTAVVVASQEKFAREKAALPPVDDSWFRSDKDYAYRIGPQDALSIVVWDHPELGIPVVADNRATAALHTVNSDGGLYFPYAGQIHVSGLTTDEIRQLLTERLGPYIKNPQVSVAVSDYRSQKIFVTGQVAKPGRVPVTDVPVRLVDAVNQAGGPTELADLHNVEVIRGDQQVTVDLKAVFEEGNVRLNLQLRDGDIVHVGDRIDKRVFVMGEVRKPGSYYPNDGHISLVDALQMAEGVNQETSDRRRIFVIRLSDEATSVYHLDISRPEALMLATNFTLVPQDVVFVAPAGLTEWNRVIRSLLPTAQLGNQVSQ